MPTAIRRRLLIFDSPYTMIRLHPIDQGLLWPDTHSTRCKLSCGGREIEIPVSLDASVPVDCVLVSVKAFRQILGNLESDWLPAFIWPNRIHLGPTIGILCNPKWDDKHSTMFLNRQEPGLRKMIGIGKQLGALVYVFGLRDINFIEMQVRAFMWQGGSWNKMIVPLPDVIYDQVLSRKMEHNSEYRERRKHLSLIYEGRIFNEGFLDKWETHRWLVADIRTRVHVPLTQRYQSRSKAATFLCQHSVTFFKPVHGSLGLGILRATRKEDGAYVVESKQAGKHIATQYGDAKAVIVGLLPRLRAKPYLLQEGIDLAHYKDRPVDVRIVLQRDGNGQWQRTKMFARVAPVGDFTANLAGGGEAYPVFQVLSENFPVKMQRKVRGELKRVALLTAEVIEQGAKKKFGELGVDLGIDQRGRVWIIEVNSKPWKAPDTHSGRRDLVELAFKRPLQYALYLAHNSTLR
ncbi:YheC/YheD family protein [Alicyclobacillaceae bacterium I2511]|nr:YheC/YheD family protein [Alicyclobacillaceae bacterium I2511]